MRIIGLCGGSGSGKGMVCSLFSELDVPFVDTDAVYREITGSRGECVRELEDCFGKEILSENGSLDRRRLSAIVFFGDDSESKLKKLNAITHRHILNETRKRLLEYEKMGAAYALVDAPVLFESGFDRDCDEIICVIAKKEIRIERIMLRDGIGRDAAERRIDSQLPDDRLISLCDHVIYNNSDLAHLKSEVLKIHNLILKNII